MKMIQAVKKFKFWSRKKKKKKKRKNSHDIEYPPPPWHCHFSYHPVQPSAPPLPPWLDYGQSHDTILAAEISPPLLGFASSSQAQLPPPQEIVPELKPLDPTLSISSTTSITSYQQYMVPNPAYGMPVAPPVRREREAGLFGCVVDIGIHLIRCFCPCFRIREVH
ncbi:uncharacterized protein LOC132294455 [Cornus florida]|uniref:uncharacterized protein LOC132294455 n=1 Tax=Cornus florida TaxID=4283 RepID=UPI00289E837B|nr:uncharacterized protein LOC132294455 [Cornus florida]